ncbi:MAG: hypothetical protein MUF37_06185, partial [Methanoregulaceae archaeon]|nr:hypothetical protein [Methanoregulaceae archaeon]
LYDYNPENVTQPKLRDAIVEIAVWSGETGLASAITSIFTEEFEPVTALGGWTMVGPAVRLPSSPCDGVACVRIRDNPGSITRTISTAGYSGITVSFDMGSQMSTPPVVFSTFEWSPDGGVTWNLLKQINAGDPEDDNNLHPFTYSLPAAADNNPAFTLRFSLNGGANAGDMAYIDNIEIGGIAD